MPVFTGRPCATNLQTLRRHRARSAGLRTIASHSRANWKTLEPLARGLSRSGERRARRDRGKFLRRDLGARFRLRACEPSDAARLRQWRPVHRASRHRPALSAHADGCADVAASQPRRHERAAIRNMFADPNFLSEEQVARCIESSPALFAILRGCLASRPPAGPPQAPTLILWGADDRHTPLASAEALQKELPASRLVTIPRGRTLAPAGTTRRLRRRVA
jgi:pimeloyl-ACP methyl ester carboxylesterase